MQLFNPTGDEYNLVGGILKQKKALWLPTEPFDLKYTIIF